MEVALTEQILAIITLDKDKVNGNVPTFFVNDENEAEHTSLLLSKVLKGMVHDLENGVFIIVKH
ncbi:hypothetical protein SAMN00017405_0207 [Desulfonispora thiosulfatigenes DSM 11270]|uniref:Uncharacterized protein n=1 Tax=Desulfonispora thiosulfatigenes DSM 11270 TaxID=656914 RepID=A0A1W1VM24_DESTI|nr:hypothetical protein [Desulfonispora thiosulfatigenes]SMB94435.1 hypothetical protein SAMN00017405_0207 [Desulfonispora thiosulfatigenes DSM 11270]